MRELKAVDAIRMIGRRVAGGRPVLGHLRGPPGPVRSRRGARHRSRRHGGVARQGGAAACRSGSPHGLEHGHGAGRLQALRRRRERALLLRALLRRAGVGLRRHPAAHGGAARHLVRARRPVHRRRGKRPAVRHPVPPGKVRRRRRPAAPQLGRRPAPRPWPRPRRRHANSRCRHRTGPPRCGPLS